MSSNRKKSFRLDELRDPEKREELEEALQETDGENTADEAAEPKPITPNEERDMNNEGPTPVTETTEGFDPNAFLDRQDEEREERQRQRREDGAELAKLFFQEHAMRSRYGNLRDPRFMQAIESKGVKRGEILDRAEENDERGNVLSIAHGASVALLLSAVDAQLPADELDDLSGDERLEHYRATARSAAAATVLTDNPVEGRFYLYNPRQKRGDRDGDYHSASHILAEVYEFRGEYFVRPIWIVGSLRNTVLEPIQEKQGWVTLEDFRTSLETGEPTISRYIQDKDLYRSLMQFLRFSIRAWQFANGELDLEEEDERIAERSSAAKTKRRQLQEEREARVAELSVTPDRVQSLIDGKQVNGVAGFFPWESRGREITAFIDARGTAEGIEILGSDVFRNLVGQTIGEDHKARNAVIAALYQLKNTLEEAETDSDGGETTEETEA